MHANEFNIFVTQLVTQSYFGAGRRMSGIKRFELKNNVLIIILKDVKNTNT